MSKTYRKNNDGSLQSDGGKNYASPRYRAGSRRRSRNVVAKGGRRSNVDLAKFGQVIIEAAILEAQRETEARQQESEADNA